MHYIHFSWNKHKCCSHMVGVEKRRAGPLTSTPVPLSFENTLTLICYICQTNTAHKPTVH